MFPNLSPENWLIFRDISILIVVHVIADAVLQSREMGKNKSTMLKWWSLHILIIYAAFTPFGTNFAIQNAAVHGVIDIIIWRVYGRVAYIKENWDDSDISFLADKNEVINFFKVYKYWEDPKFYLFIIIDQMLHVLTLIWLYLGQG